MTSSLSPTEQNTFLFEIGTEELPPGFLSTLPKWVIQYLETSLTEALIPAKDITVQTTARRIGITCKGLPSQQPDQTETLQGPPIRIAKDKEGHPSKAALAFAKKCGVDFKALETNHNGKEECLSYTRERMGKPSPEVLKTLMPTMLDKLQGPRFMRWGDYDIRFPRPIQWLTALWNDTPIDIRYHHLTASRTSQGHRFLSSGPVSIAHAKDYADTLKSDGAVLVNPTERRQVIENALHQAARALGGELVENNDLLDEVVQLVEAPSVITGHFDPAYLALPAEVIETVLASHQKYFTVKKDGVLLPHFFAISNANPAAASTIQVGYEKVVIARLSDAQFFFADDQKKPLADRVDDLSGMTFQRRLGTMRDKTLRVKAFSEYLTSAIPLSADETDHLKQAATLCKTDLTTHMVFEFTELEGTMGKAYALHQGINSTVANAIEEHYQPRFQGDDLPQSKIGALLSLADKLDTLVVVLSQEKVTMPTGSKDPIGLRRMANGILLTLIEHKFPISLSEACHWAHQQLAIKTLTPVDFSVLWAERLEPFLTQRLKSLLADQGYQPDQIDCLLGTEASPFDDLPDLFERGEVLRSLIKTPGLLEKLYEPANRLSRMLAKQPSLATLCAQNINPDLFEHDAEKNLYACIQDSPPSIADLPQLTAWQGPIAQFFEHVLVNAEDPAVKANRLTLLAKTYAPYAQLGHWGALNLEKVENKAQPIAAK